MSRWVLHELGALRPKPVAKIHQRLPDTRQVTTKAVNSADDIMGVAKSGTEKVLNKIFPDHWSFFLGEIALYSFITLVLTGIFLTFYYVPGGNSVVYHGPYTPLIGHHVTESYDSVMEISFKVRAGLLMRQAHHWACDIFIGAIAVHQARIFFTSAYRRPRSINWCVGATILALAVFNGYFGYSMPGDLMSGMGVRIGYSILLSVPFVGTYLAFWTFGGNFPGQAYFHRMYIMHVFVIPGLIVALLAVHLGLIWKQEHTQWGGNSRTEKNVVGSPLWPVFAAKTQGLFFMVAGVIFAMAAFVQIDPVWSYGSFLPYQQSYATQPDWYMGFLEGALRIMPSWQWFGFGHTIPWEVFGSAVLMPAMLWGLFYAWPWLERWFMKDTEMHHLLARPRDRPAHTAFGAGVFAFLFMLLMDGSEDIQANFFHVGLNQTLWTLRVSTVVVPVIVGGVTYRICRELQTTPKRRRRERQATVRLTPDRHYEAQLAAAPSLGEELEPMEVPGIILGPIPPPSVPELLDGGEEDGQEKAGSEAQQHEGKS